MVKAVKIEKILSLLEDNTFRKLVDHHKYYKTRERYEDLAYYFMRHEKIYVDIETKRPKYSLAREMELKKERLFDRIKDIDYQLEQKDNIIKNSNEYIKCSIKRKIDCNKYKTEVIQRMGFDPFDGFFI